MALLPGRPPRFVTPPGAAAPAAPVSPLAPAPGGDLRPPVQERPLPTNGSGPAEADGAATAAPDFRESEMTMPEDTDDTDFDDDLLKTSHKIFNVLVDEL